MTWETKQQKSAVLCGMIILGVLNISMLVVGVQYIKDCPINHYIPIYLIVAGALGVVSKILTCSSLKADKTSKLHTILIVLICILGVAEGIWMIFGSYWVYSIYEPNYNPATLPYCNEVVYFLAFWLITLKYVVVIVYIIILFIVYYCGFIGT